MARRARVNRQAIPGYEERPSRKERRREHRKVRHAAHQMLATIADPEEMEEEVIPLVRSQSYHEEADSEAELARRRFRVWKTKFWKRRDGYRDMRAKLDSQWSEIAESEEEEW